MCFLSVEKSGISDVNYNYCVVDLIGENFFNFDEIGCMFSVSNDPINICLRMFYDCEDG